MTQLTVATWNLLDARDVSRVRDRFDRLRSLDADGVAVQECKDWDQNHGRLLRLAERELGMRSYLARSSSDGCHPALFVREPFVQVAAERHRIGRPYWHGLACLETVGGIRGAGSCGPPSGALLAGDSPRRGADVPAPQEAARDRGR